jgi:hypothetical protein
MPGTSIFHAEVTHVSCDGLCVVLGDESLAVSFSEFPWFRHATVAQLSDVRRPTADHLYWPQLDIDLSVASIRDPSSHPLMARTDPH